MVGWEGGLQRQEMGWGGGGCCKGCVILVIWRLLVRALESRVASRGEERRGGVVGGISGGGGRTKGGGGNRGRSGSVFRLEGPLHFYFSIGMSAKPRLIL